MARLFASVSTRTLITAAVSASVWTASHTSYASTQRGGFPDVEPAEFDATDEAHAEDDNSTSRFWPKRVRPKRHLSINLTTFDFSFNAELELSYYSPGVEISLERVLYRFFSIGVSHGAFVVMDGGGARLVLERLGIIPRLMFPVTSDFFFSIGIPFGVDWGRDYREKEGGAGLFAAATIGLRGFLGLWGITLDVECGPNYLWGELYDVLITGPQVNLGAVYRF